MPSGRDSCPTQSSRWLAGLIAGPKDPELSVVKTFPLQSHPHLGKRGGDREQGFGWPSPLLVSDEDTEDWAPSWPGAPGSFLGASSQRLQGGLQAGGPRALPNTALHDLLQEPTLLPTTGLQGGGAPGISIWAQPERPSATGTAHGPGGPALCHKGSSSGLSLDHCSAQMSDSPPSQRVF